MAIYWIGDIQGCDGPLERLLNVLDFSPSRDHLIVLGDLINRGPESAAVLRRLMALQGSVACVLGNHDLHGLAVACGKSQPRRLDTLAPLLEAPDKQILLDWLRRQSLALWSHGVLSVHAGVLPSWTTAQTMALAGEVEAVLQSADWPEFFTHMYGNSPAAWRNDLAGHDRLRTIVNVLTRLRFCTADGVMEFATKEAAEKAPEGHMAWFDVPERQTANVTVAFGHWSTLGTPKRPNIWALDTGCVWGGCLSAMRLSQDGRHELLQVPCAQAQKPG